MRHMETCSKARTTRIQTPPVSLLYRKRADSKEMHCTICCEFFQVASRLGRELSSDIHRHIEQDELDFEKFKVRRTWKHRIWYTLTENHLSRAQIVHADSLRNGNATRSRNGFCHHTSKSAGQLAITLTSIPFLQLRDHHHRTEGIMNSAEIINKILGRSHYSQTIRAQAGSHANSTNSVRTLFQYLNPRDNSRRDLKQVVCHMLGPRDKRYLCVSHVWILIVNEGKSILSRMNCANTDNWIELIITSSTLSETALYDDLLLGAATQPTPPKQTLVNIHVESEDGRVWLLRQSDCLTYFVST
jgi:hypothetical protein